MQNISIHSLFELSYVNHPLISPDGELVAFAVQHILEEQNRYESDLYLLTRDGRTQRLTCFGDVRNYLWDEDGTLLFSSRGGTAAAGAGTALYAWTREDGVTPAGIILPEAGAELIHADAKRILFAAGHTLPADHPIQREIEAQPLDTVDVFDELPFWMNGAGVINRSRRGLYCYDRASGGTVRLTQDQFDTELISVQGDLALYTGCLNQGRKPIHSEVRLHNLATGEDKLLLPAGGYDFSYVGLWNGAAIMAAVPGSQLSAKIDCDFFRIDLETGAVTLFAPFGHACCAPGGAASDMRLGALNAVAVDGDSLYFVSHLEGSARLCRLNRDGSITENLTGEGSCDSLDARAGRLVVCGLFGDRLCELYEDGVQLTHFNDTFFAQHKVSTPEPYRFVDEDGYEIHGWCIKPVDYRPGQSYPAVLQIHGGPRVMYGSVFYHEMQVLAAAGYFVLFCNPRGSDSYGDHFAELEDRYGTVDYMNLMHFVDQMLERYPDIDPDRLGVAGGSYGGFMTNWIIGQTDRFKAAVSQRSTSLWLTFTFTGDISTIYDPFHLCGLEQEKLDRAWELSPLKYADQVKTPTLFIQADEDYRCYMCDAVMMYSALQLRGVDSRLCLFHGENHSLSRIGKPLARVRRLREMVGWFDRYLKPAAESPKSC